MAREAKRYNNLKDWKWHDNPKMIHIYEFLLSRAYRKQSQWHDIVVDRGQIVTSIRKIAEGARASIKTVRTCLDRLHASGEIRKLSTNKYTIITIVKYDQYHKSEEPLKDVQKENISKEQKTSGQPLVVSSYDANLSNESQYHSQMLGDQHWQNSMCKQFHIDKEKLHANLEAFFLDTTCRAHTHKNLKECKQHFNNWLQIKIENPEKTKDNGNKIKQNNNTRKGFEITATSAEDYKTSF